MLQVHAPLQAQVVQWQVQSGEVFQAVDLLVVLEAVKMEHEIRATCAGQVSELQFAGGRLML